MRTFLMTGSALMLLGGVALAQTPAGGQSATAGQNNTGVTGQLPGSTSGNVAGTTSGSMSNGTSAGVSGSTTGASGSPRSTSSTGSSSTTAMQPAMPSGNHTMPTQRRSTMSKGMAKSKTGTMMNKSSYVSHRMGGGMPANGTASSYLHMAQHAVMKHNKMMARDALGRAETDLLTNSYVQGSVNGPISTPAISDIRGARKAVSGGDYHGASTMIHQAMMDMHGGGMMDKSNMGASGSMGNTGMMSHGTMGNSAMSNGSMGSAASGPGAVQGKQDSTMHKQMTNATSSQ